MIVTIAAVGLILVTIIFALADGRIQKNHSPKQFRTNEKVAMRNKNTWELTQLDCDIGCAWPHTSGPARALNLDTLNIKKKATKV